MYCRYHNVVIPSMKYVREQLEASRTAAHSGGNNDVEVMKNPHHHLSGGELSGSKIGNGGYPLSTPKRESDGMQLPTLASSGLLPQNKRSVSETIDRNNSTNDDKSEMSDQPPLTRLRSS